jgi:protoporphyrinogen/coproporphyrinogen III oxidase
MGHRVAVIGGGISGLVAAERLGALGADVVLFEADPDVGGQVRAVDVAGRWVDVGAEALHIGAPGMRELVRRLGLTDRLVTAAPGSAWIWTHGGLHRVPEGVGPVGPTRIGPVMRSRVLSAGGLARAAIEPFARHVRRIDDVSVGQFITARFGPEVTERVVDPLLGTLHAGDVDRLSLHAVAPQVASLAASHRSLLLAHRARRGGPSPSFATFPEGLPALTRRLAAVSGAAIHTSTPVAAIVPDASGWRVEGARALLAQVDAVVMAVPAQVAASLLETVDPSVAGALRMVRSASVATLVASYPSDMVTGVAAFEATGLLIPSSEGRVLKATTFLSTKWPHLQLQDRVLVRLSAGRAGQSLVPELDDAQLIERMLGDFAEVAGVTAAPEDLHLHRWVEALPQLEVGHLGRVSAVRDELRRSRPNLVLAGASHDGPGLAACVRSGTQAAVAVREHLGGVVEVVG